MEVIFIYPIISCVLVFFLNSLKLEKRIFILIGSLPLLVSTYLHTQNFEIYSFLIVIICFLFPLKRQRDKLFVYTTNLFNYFIFISESFLEVQILSFFYFVYVTILYKKLNSLLLIYLFLNLYLFFNVGTFNSNLGLDSLSTLFVLNDLGVGVYFVLILITSRLFSENIEKEKNLSFVCGFILPIIYFYSMEDELYKFLINHELFICVVFVTVTLMHFVRFLKTGFDLKNENDLYFVSFLIFIFSVLKSLTIYEFIVLELFLFVLYLKNFDKTLFLLTIFIINFVLINELNLNYLMILLSSIISYRLILIPLVRKRKGKLIEAL